MIHSAVVIYNLHGLQIVALGYLPVIKTVGRGNLNYPRSKLWINHFIGYYADLKRAVNALYGNGLPLSIPGSACRLGDGHASIAKLGLWPSSCQRKRTIFLCSTTASLRCRRLPLCLQSQSVLRAVVYQPLISVNQLILPQFFKGSVSLFNHLGIQRKGVVIPVHTGA